MSETMNLHQVPEAMTRHGALCAGRIMSAFVVIAPVADGTIQLFAPARIAIELRNQYVLGYYPKDQVRDGKYHTIEVKVTQPAGLPALKLHWRQGYYAPGEKEKEKDKAQ